MLTWCAVRYMRSTVNRVNSNSVRTLYSKTGVWERNFDRALRIEIEDHWKKIVLEGHVESGKRTVTGEKKQDKFYVLSMFPYPSGNLHMGHVRVYTISDTMARCQRLQGKKVIHPMGWDAFGLPAENAAIERGELPHTWTYNNIKRMRAQLDGLGCNFDWDREVTTCDPSYYRWTQFIFLKMYEAGLVYQKEASVNWDPVDQTVLADEQIDEQGRSWRSGAKVEQRYLRQWYVRTTAYSKSLWDGLDTVSSDLWRDVILMQKNWIGQCNGCRLDFRVKYNGTFLEDPISVHTETPEAIFGISHIGVSKQHRFNTPEFHKQKYSETSDTDIDTILSLEAEHPITKKMIPIIVSMTTEEESYLGIPSVSETDRKVAARLGLTWQEVISVEGKLVNSLQFTGMQRQEGFNAVCKYAREHKFGGHLVNKRLKDWLISRQRYWGTPIPVVHCDSCKAVPVPYSDLPVELPRITHFLCKGESPLKQDQDWLNTICPVCGGKAVRETDTMDTFVDSTWYFLRYLDPQNVNLPCHPDKTAAGMPIDLYIGGKEHAVLHLYFARFINHFLCDQGLVDHREPFVDLLTQGMVMGQSYSVKGTGQYLKADEVDFSGPKPVQKDTGAPVVVQWEKMSKSKHNGVDPQEVIEEYGIDTTRLCILSNVAPKSNRNWSNEVFKGVINWQSRVWSLVTELVDQRLTTVDSSVDQVRLTQIETNLYTVRNETFRECLNSFSKTYLINAGISRLHTLTNVLKKVPTDLISSSVQFERTLADLIIVLAPMAPHFSSELWAGLSSVASYKTHHKWDLGVLQQSWPEIDMDFELPIEVKVNNTESFKMVLPRGKLESLSDEEIINYVKGCEQYKMNVERQIQVSTVHCKLYKNFGAKVVFRSADFSQRGTKTERKAMKKKLKQKLKEEKERKENVVQ